MKRWEQLTLADVGLKRSQITPTIARTVSESLRAIADGSFYGSTTRWSSEQLRALADEIEAIHGDTDSG